MIIVINDTKGLPRHVYVAYMFCVDMLSSFCIITASSVRYHFHFVHDRSFLSSTYKTVYVAVSFDVLYVRM